jgi:carbon storage regulator
MLILKRKANECIVIGHDIVVRVIGIQGDRVKIGIEAPGVSVHRQEVYERARQEAASSLALRWNARGLTTAWTGATVIFHALEDPAVRQSLQDEMDRKGGLS